MTAKVPLTRNIGTLNYTANSFDEIIMPQLPAYLYAELVYRLSGTHNKTGTVNPTIVAANPLSVMGNIIVKIGDTDVINIPGSDARVLHHWIYNRGKEVPNLVPSTADRNSTDTFAADLSIPFIMPDMASPRRGIFPTNRYTNVGFRINWKDQTEMVTGGTLTVNNLSATKVDIIATHFTGDPLYEGAKNYQLHRRTTINKPYNNVQLVDERFDIPRAPAELRGVLMFVYTPAPETPLQAGGSAVFADGDKIALVYNKDDFKIQETWASLRARNERDYGAQLPAGYVFFDLCPDGDRGRTQDTTQGVFELLLNSTNAVANANIRIIPVRYAPTV